MRRNIARRTGSVVENLESRQLLTTYFIAPTGNDNNPGTLAAPKASINAIWWSTKPGDTIYYRGGTYYPKTAEYLGSTGTAAAHITVKNYNNESVIIDGSKATTGSLDGFVIGGAYNDVSGLTIQNAKWNGVTIYQANHVTLKNCITRSCTQIGIDVTGNVAFTDVLVEGNTVYDCSKNPPPNWWYSAVVMTKGSNLVLRNNKIYENLGEGLTCWQTGPGAIIEKNTFHDNFSVDLYLMSETGAIARQNFIYSLHKTKFYRFSRPSTGISIAAEGGPTAPVSKNNLVYDNIVVGSGYGFYYGSYDRGGGLLGTTIANNIFVNCTTCEIGIDAGPHSGTKIVNNIFATNTGAAMTRIGTTGTSGLTWGNNIWFGGTPASVAVGTGDIRADPKFILSGSLNPLDYRLQATSPALNKGRLVTGISIDYSGTARVKGLATDIGAFEM